MKLNYMAKIMKLTFPPTKIAKNIKVGDVIGFDLLITRAGSTDSAWHCGIVQRIEGKRYYGNYVDIKKEITLENYKEMEKKLHAVGFLTLRSTVFKLN